MEQQNISNDLRVYEEIKSDNFGYESLAKLNDDDNYELSVLVSGVHCAGCIQKIESMLLHENQIKDARLNFSTRRLNFSWKGSADLANQYVQKIEQLGYQVQPYNPDIEKSESNKEEKFLLLCLGITGFAMGNLMIISVGVWSSTAETMGDATRGLMHAISALIALPTILFAGRPFFYSALKALKSGHTNMDVPISLALILASGMSLFETFNHGDHVYFEAAVMLMFFLLIGRYLDFRARKNARSTATDLLSSLTGFATVVDGDKTNKILIRDLRENMIVRVNSGDKFPVDGIVIDGISEVDTSLVTGETVPRAISKGTEVFAGTLNLSSPVTIKVSKAAEDSLLADIVRLMEKAGQGQAKYVRLADKAAKLYTPIVHILALIAFIGWIVIGGLEWQNSLIIAITVLIITCPCALGLAVPVVQVLATGRLVKKGVLVKSGDALERLSSIDIILLDKTGTLTYGEPLLEGDYDDKYLQIAASLASSSSHPLSKAIVNSYNGSLLKLSSVNEVAGKGIGAVLGERKIKFGSRLWCGDKTAEKSDKIELWLNIDDKEIIPFYLADHIRKDTAKTIAAFKNKGIKPIMLSGDNLEVANKIAKEAGIEEVYAQKTPTEKFDILEKLKQGNHRVLMVGDGLNDTPVLAGADVSMAPGSAIDMAQNAADIVFMGDNLYIVFDTYNTAIFTQKLVKQNFILAAIYNAIAVPLALSALVTPLIAALAMSFSSLIVIANSFRLKLLP